MNNPDPPSDSTPPRATLKLKAGVQRSAPEIQKAPQPKPAGKSSGKPGARWSDEYRDRMQAEMNALSSR
jgi:hypothetical protein